MTHDTNPDRLAAVRHLVYSDLLAYLPMASCSQGLQVAANLRLGGDWIGRFMDLRVSSDIAETEFYGMFPRLATADGPNSVIEPWFARKYGERLATVPGFYRRQPADGQPPGSWRLNLPFGCAMYGYKSATGFYIGILCQPLDRLNTFFLLSSAKYDGPKAQRLTPRDQLYFTQFEEAV